MVRLPTPEVSTINFGAGDGWINSASSNRKQDLVITFTDKKPREVLNSRCVVTISSFKAKCPEWSVIIGEVMTLCVYFESNQRIRKTC